MVRHAGELSDDAGGADLERVEGGEDVAAQDVLHPVVPGEVAVVIDDVFVGGDAAVGQDDQVAPAEAEGVEEGLADGVVGAVAAQVGALAAGFLLEAEVLEVVAEEIEDVADDGAGDVGAARNE